MLLKEWKERKQDWRSYKTVYKIQVGDGGDGNQTGGKVNGVNEWTDLSNT